MDPIMTAVLMGVGWVLKNVFAKFPNQFIPYMTGLLAAVAEYIIAFTQGQPVSGSAAALDGGMDAAAATYFHNILKHGQEYIAAKKTAPAP